MFTFIFHTSGKNFGNNMRCIVQTPAYLSQSHNLRNHPRQTQSCFRRQAEYILRYIFKILYLLFISQQSKIVIILKIT